MAMRYHDPLHFDGAVGFGRRGLPRLGLFSTPSPHPSCCGRCSNMSGWSESAGEPPGPPDQKPSARASTHVVWPAISNNKTAGNSSVRPHAANRSADQGRRADGTWEAIANSLEKLRTAIRCAVLGTSLSHRSYVSPPSRGYRVRRSHTLPRPLCEHLPRDMSQRHSNFVP